MKVICFPHAGGFSLYYAFLRKYEYKNIEKILVFDYPRSSFSFHGTSEDFVCYVNAAVDYIKANIAQDEEYILLGHSMGALVACEAGIAMQNTYGAAPAGVIVSGQNPPYAMQFVTKIEPPSDPIAFAKSLGGVPQKILDNQQMCEKLYRYAEIDLKAVYHYQPTLTEGDRRLECGMLLYGKDDIIVEQQYRSYWDRTFRTMYAEHMFEGDHFYFNHFRSEFSALLDEFAGARSKAAV